MPKKELLQKILEKLKFIVKLFINTLYPDRCPSCKKIKVGGGFCPDCWSKLIFIDKPRCLCCGKRIRVDNLICPQCIGKKYYFDQNISIFVYDKVIAKAIFEFKFKQKLFLSKFFALLMVKKINDFIYHIDYIVCVPMHLKRLRKRGYNQSFLLADDISKMTLIPFLKDALSKRKNTTRQVALNSKERKRNLKNSFFVKDKYKEILKGKNILIIDDVFTTGSTINECAKTLKKEAKAARVMSLTIAKTHKKADIEDIVKKIEYNSKKLTKK